MPEKKKHDFISVTDLKIRVVKIYMTFHRLETKQFSNSSVTISHVKIYKIYVQRECMSILLLIGIPKHGVKRQKIS